MSNSSISPGNLLDFWKLKGFLVGFSIILRSSSLFGLLISLSSLFVLLKEKSLVYIFTDS